MSAEGKCGVCGYTPVPVEYVVLRGFNDGDETAVCAICQHTDLPNLVREGQRSLARTVGAVANAFVDAQGSGFRVAFDNRLRGDPDPGGTYSAGY